MKKWQVRAQEDMNHNTRGEEWWDWLTCCLRIKFSVLSTCLSSLSLWISLCVSLNPAGNQKHHSKQSLQLQIQAQSSVVWVCFEDGGIVGHKIYCTAEQYKLPSFSFLLVQFSITCPMQICISDPGSLYFCTSISAVLCKISRAISHCWVSGHFPIWIFQGYHFDIQSMDTDWWSVFLAPISQTR